MKRVNLTQGQFATVDDEDFEALSAYKWFAKWDRTTRSYYAERCSPRRDGQKTIIMHRQILGLEFGNKLHGDHINHDTLDNRRENLRVATAQQNNCNRGKQSNSKSGFKGVCFNKRANKWKAQIHMSGKQKYLGTFDTPQAAHAAYCASAKELHGEFACLIARPA